MSYQDGNGKIRIMGLTGSSLTTYQEWNTGYPMNTGAQTHTMYGWVETKEFTCPGVLILVILGNKKVFA